MPSPRTATRATRSWTSSGSTRSGAPGALRLDPAPGAVARPCRPACDRRSLRRGDARPGGRPARPRARPGSSQRRRRRARAPVRGAVRAEGGESAGSRTSRRRSRPGTGSGPSTTSCHLALDRDIEPSLLHSWLLGPAARAARPRPPATADRLDVLPRRRRARLRAAGEPLDVVVYVAAGAIEASSCTSRPTGERSWSTSRTPTRGSRGGTDGAPQDPRAPRPPRRRASARASPSARTTTSTTSSPGMPPARARSARSSAATEPSPLPRLRRRRLEPARLPRRVWGGDRLAYRSWAVQQAAEHVASELWHERGVEVYDVSSETYRRRTCAG